MLLACVPRDVVVPALVVARRVRAPFPLGASLGLARKLRVLCPQVSGERPLVDVALAAPRDGALERQPMLPLVFLELCALVEDLAAALVRTRV